jgi:hypothetical protein
VFLFFTTHSPLSVVNCERYQAISHHSLLTYLLTHSLTLTMSHLCIHRMKPLVLATRTWRPLSTAVAAKPKRRTLESRERPAPITVVSHSHTHSLTHTFTPSLTPVLTHSLTHSLTPSLTHIHSLTYSLTYVYSYIYIIFTITTAHLPTHSPTQPLTHSLLLTLTHILTYSHTLLMLRVYVVPNNP